MEQKMQELIEAGIHQQEELEHDGWIPCSEHIPGLSDRSVLAYFPATGSMEIVHVEDYFKPITAGRDPKTGNQLFSRWYTQAGISHWRELPEPPKTE